MALEIVPAIEGYRCPGCDRVYKLEDYKDPFADAAFEAGECCDFGDDLDIIYKDVNSLAEILRNTPEPPPVTIRTLPMSPMDLVEQLTGVRPQSGVCIFCSKELTKEDTDHSVCNSCWTENFACKVCGDESGECEHQE